VGVRCLAGCGGGGGGGGDTGGSNTGPRGNNNNGTATLGDVDDWFRLDLVAGQVVELEFASDPASADVGPQLLQLPSTDAERRQGLRALAARGATDGRGKTEAAAWPEAMATLRLAKRLRASGAFEYVEPNRYVRTTALTGTFPPNDRLYAYQRWHYEQISLPSAMERIVGLNLPASQTRPLVAVIDDGIVSDHPDLAPQLFSAGRAFVSLNTEGDADRTSAENLATAAAQPVFHGTHVAGTVAAASFDGIGGAGTAPMAQIVPLRVFPANSRARSLDVIAAMRYAAGLSNRTGFVPTRRADVINLSLGSDNACDGAYRTAIADVRAAGTLVVVAAGNGGAQQLGRTGRRGFAGQLRRGHRRQCHRCTPQNRQLLQHRHARGGGRTGRRCFRLHHRQRSAGQRLQRHRHFRRQRPAPTGIRWHARHFDGGAARGRRDGADGLRQPAAQPGAGGHPAGRRHPHR
jgi:hypothetical protein